MNEVLATTVEGGVLRITLAAPSRRNALSRPMLSELVTALGGVPGHVTGVVLHGAGEVFSAGADFAELTGTSADLDYDEAVSEARRAIAACRVPVVAAIEGPCMGAATDLALACDARVAAEKSFLQIPAASLGILYNPEVVSRVAWTYGLDAARRLFLLGERMPAATAYAAGLVTKISGPGQAVSVSINILAGSGLNALEARAATKELLADLEPPGLAARWQKVRTDLLDSPARQAAVAQARARHAHAD